jgi:hypothetical protein
VRQGECHRLVSQGIINLGKHAAQENVGFSISRSGGWH